MEFRFFEKSFVQKHHSIIQGIWAGGVEDVTVTAINHKYRLMAFGRANSHGVVYAIDESTGGLELSHRSAEQ